MPWYSFNALDMACFVLQIIVVMRNPTAICWQSSRDPEGICVNIIAPEQAAHLNCRNTTPMRWNSNQWSPKGAGGIGLCPMYDNNRSGFHYSMADVFLEILTHPVHKAIKVESQP